MIKLTKLFSNSKIKAAIFQTDIFTFVINIFTFKVKTAIVEPNMFIINIFHSRIKVVMNESDIFIINFFTVK